MRTLKMDDNETGMREALASTSSMQMQQPNLNQPGVSKAQISKFQELQRKILQIKAKSNKQKGSKDLIGKSIKKNLGRKEDPALSNPQKTSVCTAKEENLVANKNKQKLHWGLDVKERWERKANM